MIHRYFYSTKKDAPGILKMSLSKFPPKCHGEVRLLTAVMETGLIDLDYEYISGGGLQLDCEMLQLDYRAVRAAYLGMAEIIKLNKEWE